MLVVVRRGRMGLDWIDLGRLIRASAVGWVDVGIWEFENEKTRYLSAGKKKEYV
jgi:hypothetical protein